MPSKDRFFRKGITRFYWVPIIANPAAPTVAEVGAGIRMDGEMASISGFRFSNSPIGTPDFESTFQSQIPGEDSADNSSITIYERKTATPLRVTLAKDTDGFVVIFPTGIAGSTPAAADKAEVWPVRVGGNNREYSSGADPARIIVDFSVTDKPTQSATVSAS